MKTFLAIILTLLAFNAHAINWGGLQYWHAGMASRPFAVTIADDGAGTAAASTLTAPVFATYRYTCSDTDGCDLTIGETNVVDGQYLTIYNVSANAITLTDAAGVLELSAATIAIAQFQQALLQYQSDRWVEMSTSTGGGGVAVGGSITGSVASCVLYTNSDGATLGCEAGMTYNPTTDTVTVTGIAIGAGKIERALGALNLATTGANDIRFSPDGVQTWNLSTTSFHPQTHNVEDLGTTAKRVKTGYFGTSVDSVAYVTATNCADSAGDSICAAAPAGSVVVDAADTNTVVSTTAVTANSQIFLQVDASLGTRLAVTCNTQAASVFNPRVTARTAGTSFTITVDAGPTTDPLCISYFIIN